MNLQEGTGRNDRHNQTTDAEANASGRSPRRTRLDIMLATVEQLLGAAGVEKFRREALPQLKLRPEAYDEISEQEYQEAISKVRTEAPWFARFLLQMPDMG